MEIPVKTNICLATTPLFVPLRNAFVPRRLFIRMLLDVRDIILKLQHDYAVFYTSTITDNNMIRKILFVQKQAVLLVIY